MSEDTERRGAPKNLDVVATLGAVDEVAASTVPVCGNGNSSDCGRVLCDGGYVCVRLDAE